MQVALFFFVIIPYYYSLLLLLIVSNVVCYLLFSFDDLFLLFVCLRLAQHDHVLINSNYYLLLGLGKEE